MDQKTVTPPSDEALLLAIADGSKDAFVHFVRRFRGPTQRYVARVVQNLADAEDIVQEVFLSVLRDAAGFEGRSSARSWVFGIARNKIGRSRRRRAGEPLSFESIETLGLKAGWGNPEALTQARHRLSQVQVALDALDHDAREVLLLRDVEGLSGPEVADVMGVSVSAMKSRLHRARLALMAKLQEVDHAS